MIKATSGRLPILPPVDQQPKHPWLDLGPPALSRGRRLAFSMARGPERHGLNSNLIHVRHVCVWSFLSHAYRRYLFVASIATKVSPIPSSDCAGPTLLL